MIAIFKQMPTLLMALKLVHDAGNIGDRSYESAPNYDAQASSERLGLPLIASECLWVPLSASSASKCPRMRRGAGLLSADDG